MCSIPPCGIEPPLRWEMSNLEFAFGIILNLDRITGIYRIISPPARRLARDSEGTEMKAFLGRRLRRVTQSEYFWTGFTGLT
jgi:hypothetical protein